MTYVRAEALDGGVFMRSDIAVSVMAGEEIASQFPFPKILVLDPSFVIGIAGDDPKGGMAGVLHLWADCESAESLRAAIEKDGALLRQFLMLTATGEVWTYAGGSWSGPRSEGWIGSQEARQLQDPDPFGGSERELSDAERDADREREHARKMGFDEEDIEFVLSGQSARELGPEIAQRDAMRAAGADVSEFMLEARLVDGKFRFIPQTDTARVFGSPILGSEQDVDRALLGPGLAVSHQFHTIEGRYPAVLSIEFLGASVTFAPCLEGGYSRTVELLDPSTQSHLQF